MTVSRTAPWLARVPSAVGEPLVFAPSGGPGYLADRSLHALHRDAVRGTR